MWSAEACFRFSLGSLLPLLLRCDDFHGQLRMIARADQRAYAWAEFMGGKPPGYQSDSKQSYSIPA